MEALDRALLDVEQMVRGDAVDPGFEPTAEVELREPRDHAHEDLLSGVLGILAIPQHPQGETMDVALQRAHQIVDGVPIAVHGASREPPRAWSVRPPASGLHQRLERRELLAKRSTLLLEGTFDLLEWDRRRVKDEAVDAGPPGRLRHARL